MGVGWISSRITKVPGAEAFEAASLDGFLLGFVRFVDPRTLSLSRLNVCPPEVGLVLCCSPSSKDRVCISHCKKKKRLSRYSIIPSPRLRASDSVVITVLPSPSHRVTIAVGVAEFEMFHIRTTHGDQSLFFLSYPPWWPRWVPPRVGGWTAALLSELNDQL